jgi:hypothetical protein
MFNATIHNNMSLKNSQPDTKSSDRPPLMSLKNSQPDTKSSDRPPLKRDDNEVYICIYMCRGYMYSVCIYEHL